ncbi:MAG: YDG domain-containing protein [Pyrinomonadaceae bacterium]
MSMQPFSPFTLSGRTLRRLLSADPNNPGTNRRHRTLSLRLLGLVALATIALAATLASASSARQLFLGLGLTGIEGSVSQPSQPKAAFSNLLLTSAPDASSLTLERRGHTATLLAEGRVLIVGGENTIGVLSQTEIFDPTTGVFSAGGNLSNARADHSATRLSDGRVLIAGGRGTTGALTTSEIFDPATGAFASGPAMSVARAGHSATLLADGRVLIAGGDENGSAEIFDPSTGAFSTVGANLNSARSMHSAALLLDGRVLIVGGRALDGSTLNTVELFDPAVSSFSSAGELTVGRELPHLRVLFDGKVQIVGGNNDESMEIYDPSFPGLGAYAHVLPQTDTCSGLRPGILTSQTRAALFHNGQPDPQLDRTAETISELTGTNQALVAGGVNSAGSVLDSFSILGSSAASITTDKLDYAPGETVTISGRGYQPGETVRVKIHEDPHTPQERGFDITAEADGSFSGSYLVQDYDLSMRFIVSARGLTSGWTAHTTFTDSRIITSATLDGSTSVAVASGATISATVNVTTNNGGGNSNWRSTGWRISNTPPGTVTCFNNANHDGIGSYSETFNITAPVAAGTYHAYFIAYSDDSCSNQPSNTFQLTNGVVVDATNPTVTSINRAAGSPTNAPSVTWSVTFSESVTGVDTGDFALANIGLTGSPVITGVSGSGASYTVTASTGNGTGTLQLNLNDNDSIADAGANKLGGTGSGVVPGGSGGNGSFAGQAYSLNRTLTPAVTASDKTYDGNSTATILTSTFTSALTVSDDVSVSGGTATFDTANAGPGKTVTATGLSLTGADAARYILSSTTATTTANISKADATIVVNGFTGIYDGAAHGASGTATGVLSEALTGLDLGASFTNVPGGTANWTFTDVTGNYNDAAGTAAIVINQASSIVTVTCPGTAPTYTGVAQTPCTAEANGAGMSPLDVTASLIYGSNIHVGTATADGSWLGDINHTGDTGSATFEIAKATLTITAVTHTKPYDGNNTAAAVPTVSGLQGSDTVTGLVEIYDNKHAGSGKTLSVSAYTVNDGNGGNNYDVHTSTNTTGVINTVALSINAVPNTKLYDGNTSAGAIPTVSGLQGTDTVTGLSEVYDTKHAGTAKTLSVSAFTVNDGNSGNNYDVHTFTSNSGVINQAPLTINALANTKIYDGTGSATAMPSVSGLQGSDTVTDLVETYDNENVGTGKTLTVVGYTVNDGNGGGNYNVSAVPNNAGVITKRPITVTAVANTKIYNGNTSSSGIPTVTSGSIVAGDTGNFTQTFDTPFVGSGKTLTPAGSVNDGNAGNNYLITFATVSTGVITTSFCFDGFLSPIGGSVETINGGSFAIPVKSFKLGSTIPVKFAISSWNGSTCGSVITTGIHTLQAIRYSTSTASDPPIDATPTDAATSGNQFRLTDSQWHFNLSTKGALFNQGTWLLQATLEDGSLHTVWISLKK